MKIYFYCVKTGKMRAKKKKHESVLKTLVDKEYYWLNCWSSSVKPNKANDWPFSSSHWHSHTNKHTVIHTYRINTNSHHWRDSFAVKTFYKHFVRFPFPSPICVVPNFKSFPPLHGLCFEHGASTGFDFSHQLYLIITWGLVVALRNFMPNRTRI